MIMDLNETRRKKIDEQKRKMTGFDYIGICFGCKCQLKTQKEKDQNYCEQCWGQYCDEYDAMYGDDGRTRCKQNKKS